MAAETEVRLPDIGDFSSVEVIEILVSPGDRVEKDASLLTLESDKATMEVPSPSAGKVTRIEVGIGDKISQGAMLLWLEAEQGGEEAGAATEQVDEGTSPLPLTEGGEESAEAGATPSDAGALAKRLPGEKERLPPPVLPRPADMVAIAEGRKPHASPAVRRFARELGVDLSRVGGSGPKGRIIREDVQGFVQKALREGVSAAPAAPGPWSLPAAPEVDFSKFGEIETVPLGRIRKLSGAHLHRSWLGIPHVTQFDEADITDLESFRKEQKEAVARDGVSLTFMPFLLTACAAALRAMPRFNSSLAPDGEQLILKKYLHVGVAVDTPNGLVVPVVRDVDSKGVIALARELGELSAKAREGKLLPGDMQGGCFSISSLGGIGGTQFSPVVNAPEVAILGVSRAQTKPVWNGTEFVPRVMLPLALSYDHRVIDGAEGVRFTTYLARLLGDIRTLLL